MRWIIPCFVVALYGCGENAQKSSTSNLPLDARSIFTSKCALCHGHDGKQQYAGAKNLGESVLTSEEVNKIISEGKGNMPPHRGTLSAEEIQLLTAYVITLRNP